MKKLRVLALLSVLLLCLTLCGCDVDVSEMRSRHGQWDAGGNIVLNGAVYKPLPDCGMLVTNIVEPYYSAYSENSESEPPSVYYVTESDVPVLFSESEGTPFSADADEVFLQKVDSYFGTYFDGLDTSSPIYCRDDHYDSILSQIENGIANPRYHYEYPAIQEDGTHGWEKYRLTDAEVAAVTAVLKSGTAISSQLFDYAFDRTVVLYVESEDGFFYGDSDLRVRQVGDTYYVHDFTPAEYDMLYPVPEEYHDVFASLMAAVVAAEQQMR